MAENQYWGSENGDMRARKHTVVSSVLGIIFRWLVLLLLPGTWWVLVHGLIPLNGNL